MAYVRPWNVRSGVMLARVERLQVIRITQKDHGDGHWQR